MTLLEKTGYLIDVNNLNKRQLAIESDIPYSTVDNWWKKGIDNIRLPTFRKLCNYFNVTMDSMAFDDQEIQYKTDLSPAASPDTQRVAAAYDQADYFHQQMVKETLGIRTDKEKGGDASTVLNDQIV